MTPWPVNEMVVNEVVTSARAAQAPGRPLQPQRCCASLRDRLRRPLTLEPLPTLRQDHHGQVTALPATTRRPSSAPDGQSHNRLYAANLGARVLIRVGE